jgi:2-amino-4-hydroxy-6-hydroxymethyldihydropteridine diphosphokinase
MVRCYVGFGGNIGDSAALCTQALNLLENSQGISDLLCSRFYHTSPVECESEQPFLNCVATFTCTLSVQLLFCLLQKIECILGKVPKPKNAPRLIDIDLLFYGSHLYYDASIIIPHPRWHTRLFVVQPLAELTSTLKLTPEGTPFSIIINIQKMLSFLQNQNKEQITLYEID